MEICLVTVKTFKKLIIFLKKNRFCWCELIRLLTAFAVSLWVLVKMLNATSVEWTWTTDDAMNLPGKKQPKEIHLLGFMSTLPGYWMSLANYSFIFWIFFCKGANFFFSNSAFFRFTISEPDYLTCLWLQSAVFLIMSVICDLYSVLRGMYEETLLEPDNRTWSTRESIRERMMCLDLTSFIHCALPVCLRSAL